MPPEKEEEEDEEKAAPSPSALRVDFGGIYRRRVLGVLLCGGAAGAAAAVALSRRYGHLAAAGATSAAVVLIMRLHEAPRRKLRAIPGPSPGLLGGNLRETYEAPNGIAECSVRWHQEHGPLVRVQLGSEVSLMCSDPLEIERYLRGMESFLNRPRPPLRMPFPQLLFARDNEWKRMRRTIAPIFSEKQLRVFASPMQQAVNVLLEILHASPPGRSVNIWSKLGRMTMDVIGSSAFGVQLDCQKTNSALAEAAEQLFSGGMFSRMSMPAFLVRMFPWVMPLVVLRLAVVKLLKIGVYGASKVIDTTVHSMILQRRANPVEQKDLLELLLEARDSETGRWLSDDEVHGNSRIMLLAGYETTSNALAYAIFLLAQNPEAERLMLAEIDRIQGPPSVRATSQAAPAKEELSAYTYVSWVCQEALRLLPPAPIYTRQASRDLEVCGYAVPAGSTFIVSAFAIHRDARYYPDPLMFRPERWDPVGKEHQQRPESAFLPFGIGVRKCVGYRFALQEMQLTLLRLYSEFTFRLDPAMPLPLQLDPGITMSPMGGIHVLPQRRF